MKNKTLTLTEKNIEGNGILYSGDYQKRKLGSWMFGHRKEILRPIKLETKPEVSICSGEFFTTISFYLNEREKYMLNSRDSGRYEERIDKVLGTDKEGYDRILFTRIENKDKDKKDLIVKGENIISIYRTFELLNESKKIPLKKDWHYSHGESWAGLPIIEGYYNLNWTDIYKQFLLDNKNPSEKLIDEIEKKTNVKKAKIEEITNLYPLDDNKEEIRESDLVRLILK